MCLRNRLPRPGELLRHFREDGHGRGMVTLYASFAVNVVYALWETGCGVWYRSFWFLTLGVYYLLLVALRASLLAAAYRERRGAGQIRKTCRLCGILLLAMNLILSGVVVLATLAGHGAQYAGYLVYAVAVFTFWRVASSVWNLVQNRRRNDPVVSASKVISFASALVSLLSLEITLCRQFGDDEAFLRTMTAATGAGVCVLLTACAVGMLLVSRNHWKEPDQNRPVP